MLTIVMYHYVRNLKNSSYPRIKGLSLEDFDGQLNYLQQHYSFVELEQVAAALKDKTELPPNACLLTFDDGFSDHYENVFPRLLKYGIKGAFYPPVKPILERTVLDVHKIHFILASSENPSGLVQDIFELLQPHRKNIDLPDDEEFARELYLGTEQLKEMVSAGMAVGVHGYSHRWLNSLTTQEQATELDLSLSFLKDLYGERPRDWTVCYPYGGYNEETLRLLTEKGCVLGLTARVALVEDFSNPLLLPRLDTNDLPKNGAAKPCEWTRQLRLQ